MSNIHAIPNEILINIFLFLASRPPGEYSLRELRLGHVCSRWRLISVSIPLLWTSICVLIHEDPDSNGVRTLTQLYLDRSRSSPLDVYIDVDEVQGLWNMLWPHAHRWRSAHFRALDYDLLQLSGQSELPMLESLALARGSESFFAPCEITLWSSAPCLYTISLDMTFYTLFHFVLPWNQILRLAIEGSDMDQMHQALCLCTNVCTATFLRCASDFSYRDPIQYTCHYLSSLTIVAERRCETLGPDITHCIFPSLSILCVIGGSQEFSFSHEIVPTLAQLILRSECPLSELTLHGISYTPRQLMELLQVVSPYLTKLDLCDVDHRAWNFMQIDTWLIKAMIWAGTRSEFQVESGSVSGKNSSSAHSESRSSIFAYALPGYLLPHLKEFGIRFPSLRKEIQPDHDKIDALLRMVESRCLSPSIPIASGDSLASGTAAARIREASEDREGTALEKLHLGRLWFARMPPEFEDRLRVLEDGGLKITAM